MDPFKKLAFPVDQPLKLPPLPASCLQCTWLGDEDRDKYDSTLQNGATWPFAVSPVILSDLKSARILTKGNDVKTVMNIELNVKGHNVDFLPGDTIGIIPQNAEFEVKQILRQLGLSDKAKELVQISLLENKGKKSANLPQFVPPYSTAEEFLRTCLEIRAIPKKAFLRALGEHTSDEEEKRRLLELSSREGGPEYQKFFIQHRFNLLDIFEIFPSCKPPLSLLLEHLPRLQSRPYSIASSPLSSSENIHVVLSVIEDYRGRQGICSGWLHRLTLKEIDLNESLKTLSLEEQSKTKIPVYFRKPTKFRIPESISTPMIMIGPGTGVSPFIGFLRHRKLQKKTSTNHGENWLYFGCRYTDRDHIFKDEMTELEQEKVITKLFTSFSRESNLGAKYVQDSIQLQKEEFVNQILLKECHVFLCGEVTRTIKDIEETITCCIKDVKGLSQNEAKAVLKDLEDSGRLLKDNWA